MGSRKNFKEKYLDFEHPPKPRTLAVADAVLLAVILICYALVQHVLPSHFIQTKLSQLASKNEPVAVTVPVTDPAPAPVTTPAPKRPEDMTPEERFAVKFSDTVQVTENSYKSPDISVEISEKEFYNEQNEIQHCYIADIYVADVHSLQTYVHKNDMYGECGDSMVNLSAYSGSIVALNGDYAMTTNSGVIIRNGKVLRDKPSTSEICILYEDGTVQCLSGEEYDSETVQKKGAWQAWTFGPSLLDNRGKARSSYPSTYGNLLENNPRSIFGYYEPGHYCLIAIDGRRFGYAIGLDMDATAALVESLGCKLAFNLDGGRSTQMTFFSQMINDPYKQGRYVGDIILVKEPEETPQ